MAHEFAHYGGAVGPEGVRRTVTYYGPVIGGLPIDAWHCERCGLLRLSFPDGRQEERRLFPGPQPGLIAQPSDNAPEKVMYGMQARVSGLTESATLARRFAAEMPIAVPVFQFPQVTLPAWDVVTWALVLGLSAVSAMLLLLALFATVSYSTPSVEVPLAITAGCTFVATVVFALGVVAVRHFFPAEPLSPSIAESARGAPQLDGATRTAVAFMSLAAVGLFIAAILAVYTYATPGAEGPVFIISVLFAVIAAAVKIIDVAVRHFFPSER